MSRVYTLKALTVSVLKMKFKPLTFVPIDLDLVDTAWLEKKDIERLNAYHAAVYSRLSPHLSGEELEFLKQYTRPVE